MSIIPNTIASRRSHGELDRRRGSPRLQTLRHNVNREGLRFVATGVAPLRVVCSHGRKRSRFDGAPNDMIHEGPSPALAKGRSLLHLLVLGRGEREQTKTGCGAEICCQRCLDRWRFGGRVDCTAESNGTVGSLDTCITSTSIWWSRAIQDCQLGFLGC